MITFNEALVIYKCKINLNKKYNERKKSKNKEKKIINENNVNNNNTFWSIFLQTSHIRICIL